MTIKTTPKLPQDEMQLKIARDEVIIFVSSSGHCNLDCTYCVVTPVVKHEPSLTYEDLRFILDKVGKKVFLIFSGVGDFFAGYTKKERFLDKLLTHENIAVALDINGVVIHCFEELSQAQIDKIRHINLSMHYQQLIRHNALKVWRKNALTLLQKADSADFFLNFILSSPESSIWEDALSWYETNVFADYPKKIILIKDVNIDFTESDHRLLENLQARFGHIIQSVRLGAFAEYFQDFEYVTCPAGQEYFRIWNDGRIEACPNVAELKNGGNAKERTFFPRSKPFDCSDVRYCDCYHIANAGKMIFHPRKASQPDVKAAFSIESMKAKLKSMLRNPII